MSLTLGEQSDIPNRDVHLSNSMPRTRAHLCRTRLFLPGAMAQIVEKTGNSLAGHSQVCQVPVGKPGQQTGGQLIDSGLC